VNTNPTANEILTRMSLAYKSTTTYVDRGTVSTVFTNDDVKRVVSRPFQIAFVRGGSFRFEHSDSESPGSYYIVWSDGSQVLTSWFARPGIKPARDLDLALAGATGVSGGSAHTTPRLLMPDIVTGFALTELGDPSILGSEPLAGHDCWKLQGMPRFNREPIVLWIDRDTYLLRQVSTHRHFEARAGRPEFTTDDLTTYDPVINLPVDPTLLSSPAAPGS
jgi:hypothetical protein